MADSSDEGEDGELDRNVYYATRGWTPPTIPVAFQISKQDLVILMTVCSQVRFLVTGQARDYSRLRPTDVSSAITQDILDIEQTLMDGKRDSSESVVGVEKVVITKKGAHSPIEKEESTSTNQEEGEIPFMIRDANDDDDGSCILY